MIQTFNKIKSFFMNGQHLEALRRLCNINLRHKNITDYSSLIIFLVPNEDFRSGGILSLYNIADITTKLLPNARVEIATYGSIQLVFRPRWFTNEFNIRWFKNIIKREQVSTRIVIHCPEISVLSFLRYLESNNLAHYVSHATFNILNQNSYCAPTDKIIKWASEIFKDVTMTLAFKANDNLKYNYLSIDPIYISSGFYGDTASRPVFSKKENICVISPDENVLKNKIVEKIENAGIKCVQFKTIKFSDFVRLQNRAKWTVTFGEGYDGYSGPQFKRGGIGFGVYDDRFFPKSINKNNLPPFFFESYESMLENIVDVMKTLDNEGAFKDWGEYIDKLVQTTNGPEVIYKGVNEYYKNVGLM